MIKLMVHVAMFQTKPGRNTMTLVTGLVLVRKEASTRGTCCLTSLRTFSFSSESSFLPLPVSHPQILINNISNNNNNSSDCNANRLFFCMIDGNISFDLGYKNGVINYDNICD